MSATLSVLALLAAAQGADSVLPPTWASGTAWAPATADPHHPGRPGVWQFRTHGFANAGYTGASGPRGAAEAFTTNMVMIGVARRVGATTIALRAMGSLEPAMGADGYPLPLQTGETADGVTPLFDRQHPHDALMELALLLRTPLREDLELVLYGGPVGEPAVGPVPFPHRASATDIPVAPISHHFLDATHISHGVVTVGFVARGIAKLEVSAFNGREPDQARWAPDAPALDSWAGRFTVAPTPAWVVQGSVAGLDSPEQLHPGIGQVRLTLSVSHGRRLAAGAWHSTLAWGRNKRDRTTMTLADARRTFSPPVLDHYLGRSDFGNLPEDSVLLIFPARVQPALLLESTLVLGPHTLFTRLERVQKDELIPPADPRHSDVFAVSQATAGYAIGVSTPVARLGVGVAGSLHIVPGALADAYGGRTTASWMVFTRARW